MQMEMARANEKMIRSKQLLRTKKVMNELLARHTGQPLERIEKDTDRDNFMTAREAKEYGIVDHVLERVPAVHLNRPSSS